MEDNREKNTGYTGEYGNPVEHAHSASNSTEQQDSTYRYSYQDGNGETTHSGDYYNENKQSGASDAGQTNYGSQQFNNSSPFNAGPQPSAGQQAGMGPQQSSGQQNFAGKNKKKPEKSGSIMKKLLVCAACAVVFGLVAGVCFQGVRYMSDRFLPATSTTKTKLKTTTEGSDVASNDATKSNGGNTVTTNSGAMDVSGIVEQTMPSIVAITSTTKGANYYDLFGQQYEGQDTTSSGSGFIVGQNDKELLIATNNHVIDGAKTISVQFNDESICEATVKGTDSSNDLAVVAVPVSKIKDETMDKIRIADLGSSDDLKVGEMAIAIGNALGYGQSVTVGYISAKDREISEDSQSTSTGNTIKAIQTDAAINPGNSGGALINMQGQVIGINSAKIADSAVEGVGYAIPISVATPIIEDLMNKESLSDSDKGYLGISGQTVTEEATSFNLPKGVYVVEVSKGGAADKAGIQEGDIITSINNMEVRSIESLQEKANSYKKGTKVEITVQRSDKGNYKEKTFTVTLQGSDSLDNLSESSDNGSSQNDSEENGRNNSGGNNYGNGSGNDGFDFGQFFGN